MDFLHGFGIRDDEIVIASVVLFAAKMFGGEMLVLQAGAHRAVEDEDFLFEGVEVFSVCIFSVHVAPELFLYSSINLFAADIIA